MWCSTPSTPSSSPLRLIEQIKVLEAVYVAANFAYVCPFSLPALFALMSRFLGLSCSSLWRRVRPAGDSDNFSSRCDDLMRDYARSWQERKRPFLFERRHVSLEVRTRRLRSYELLLVSLRTFPCEPRVCFHHEAAGPSLERLGTRKQARSRIWYTKHCRE
ncbi:hypothetical protein IW262DRAFT_345839 [Armillaria fumosa]|nr:hypothetical protein IW262DRAFT_345839 [Armillaria fumosa]